MPLTLENIDILHLHDDDLVWTVKADIHTVAEFLDDPLKFIAELNRLGKEKGALTGDQQVTIAEHFTARVRPVSADEAVQYQDALSGFEGKFVDIPEFLRRKGVEIPSTSENTAGILIHGISGTGYVSIDPIRGDCDLSMLVHPGWNRHWDRWTTVEDTTLGLLPNEKMALHHMELTVLDDPDRGEKLAAFLLLGSRSLTHLCRFLDKQPNILTFSANTPQDHHFRQNPPKFAEITAEALSSITFSHITQTGVAGFACEIHTGNIQGDVVRATDFATKLYPMPVPPPVTTVIGTLSIDHDNQIATLDNGGVARTLVANVDGQPSAAEGFKQVVEANLAHGTTVQVKGIRENLAPQPVLVIENLEGTV